MFLTDSFLICIVSPPGYKHSGALQEVAETLCFGLRRLGHNAMIQRNSFAADARNIILGAHLINERHIGMIPAGSILYNFEQIDPASKWLQPTFLHLLRNLTVWDYSLRNIEQLHQACLGRQVRYVPLGYVAEMSRIAAVQPQDIDVLFYGSINVRRSKILDALRDAGLNVHVAFGIYGQERDSLVARAKLVLNIHYYDTSIFEIVRISYLLANRKAVVTECHSGTEIDPDMQDAVAAVAYEDLVDACRYLITNVQQRQALEERGFVRMAARDELEILRAALSKEDA